MALPLKILSFIAILGTVVTVHELGHMLAARLLGVRVIRFSVGFGPRVWGFRRGETEYQLSLLPLGGYVRLGGLVREERATAADRPQPVDNTRSADDDESGVDPAGPLNLPAPTRLAISLAGPVANIVCVPLMLLAAYLVPQPQPAAVLGWVVPGEAADRAGLRTGDRVTAVDGTPIAGFSQLSERVKASPGRSLNLTIERVGQPLTVAVTPTADTEAGPVTTHAKGRLGIMAGSAPVMLGVRPGSAAAQSGLQTFDRVVSVNDAPATIAELMRTARDGSAADGRTHRIVVERGPEGPAAQRLTFDLAATQLSGVESADLYVQAVKQDDSAWQAGLRPGDRLVALDDEPLTSGPQLALRLARLDQPPGAAPTTLRWRVSRQIEGKAIEQQLAHTPPRVVYRDRWIGKRERPELGFAVASDALLGRGEPELVTVQRSLPQAVEKARTELRRLVGLMLEALFGLLSGAISTDTIGGPMLMFQATSTAAEVGLTALLQLLALLSLDVAFMNLLPIPGLDGFAAGVAAAESISGRLLPARVREVLAWVGIFMIVALALLALRNDILRTFFADV